MRLDVLTTMPDDARPLLLRQRRTAGADRARECGPADFAPEECMYLRNPVVQGETAHRYLAEDRPVVSVQCSMSITEVHYNSREDQ